MSSESSSPDAERFGADPKPYFVALGVLVVLEFVRRAFFGFVPDDFTAYLSAADNFAAGLNPYTDYAESARYDGKPYNYLPGTLYFIVWMAYVPTAVAVAVDWIARVTALFFALRYLARRIVPDIPFHFVLLIALACQPLFVDMLFGNLVSYLLAAWAGCAYLSEQRATPRRMVAAAGCGIILAFKPFWGIPAAYCFFVHRNWRGLAALAAGAAIVGGLSSLHIGWADEFVAHTEAMREFYYSVDFLNLAPALLPVVAGIWGIAALYIARRGDPEWSWLFGCTALVIFPRLATYSYSLTLPIILFLVHRWGALKGLLYGAVLIGPIPWLLRVAPWMPGERLENWTHFIWTIVTAVVLASMLSKRETR